MRPLRTAATRPRVRSKRPIKSRAIPILEWVVPFSRRDPGARSCFICADPEWCKHREPELVFLFSKPSHFSQRKSMHMQDGNFAAQPTQSGPIIDTKYA